MNKFKDFDVYKKINFGTDLPVSRIEHFECKHG